MTHISDEFLLAYLDGQLEASQASTVTELAGANAEITRRLVRLRRTQAQLNETFQAFASCETPVPSSLFPGAERRAQFEPLKADRREAVPRPKPAGNASRKAVFISAVFASGLLGGYGATLVVPRRADPPKTMDRVIPQPAPAQPPMAAAWASDIARFHAYFPRETLTPHPDAISGVEFIRLQSSKVAGRALSPPDFSRQGYTLSRGQVFNSTQERMMQITYASKTEPPLTLYVAPASGTAEAPISTQTLGSNRAATWVSDRVRFFLTGEKNEEDLKVLAVVVQSQTGKKQ